MLIIPQINAFNIMQVHERFWTTLSHEEPDRVPTFVQTIEPGFIEKFDTEIEIKGKPVMQGIELQVGKETGIRFEMDACRRLYRKHKIYARITARIKT